MTSIANIVSQQYYAIFKRLQNAIICWNYLYLTQLFGQARTEERGMELLEAMKNGSVVSWHHTNLHGEYDFSDDKLQDSVGLDLPKTLGILEGKKWELKNQAKVLGMSYLRKIL
jgi:Tn3 transposase DDE domain